MQGTAEASVKPSGSDSHTMNISKEKHRRSNRAAKGRARNGKTLEKLKSDSNPPGPGEQAGPETRSYFCTRLLLPPFHGSVTGREIAMPFTWRSDKCTRCEGTLSVKFMSKPSAQQSDLPFGGDRFRPALSA